MIVLFPISVDGGWSEWESWTKCSSNSGPGVSHRSRSCNNPRPRNLGRACSGDATQTKRCDNSKFENMYQIAKNYFLLRSMDDIKIYLDQKE